MTDEDENKQQRQGRHAYPAGEGGSSAHDVAAPDAPEDVDPEQGTNQDGEPIDNPSGG